MWCWRRIEKIKWSDKLTNERVLEHTRIGEKRTLLNDIIGRKANGLVIFSKEISSFMMPLTER